MDTKQRHQACNPGSTDLPAKGAWIQFKGSVNWGWGEMAYFFSLTSFFTNLTEILYFFHFERKQQATAVAAPVTVTNRYFHTTALADTPKYHLCSSLLQNGSNTIQH